MGQQLLALRPANKSLRPRLYSKDAEVHQDRSQHRQVALTNLWMGYLGYNMRHFVA